MSIILLVASLGCGLLTLVFILNGQRAARRGGAQMRRGLIISAALSALTALFTIWNLVQTLQQLNM